MENSCCKKTIAVATDVPFWNVSAGNEQRISQVINFFRQSCDVIVLYIGYTSKKDQRKIASYGLKNVYCAFEWKSILKDRVKLIVNTYFPALRHILKKMRKPGSLNTRRSLVAKKKLRDIFSKTKVDVLCVEYVWLTYLFEDVSASVLKIVDTHDIQFDRCESFRNVGLNYDFNISEEDELKCLNLADVILAINHRDCEILSKKTNAKVVEYPYLPEKKDLEKRNQIECTPNRYRVAFIGSAIDFNIRALDWFCNKVWPYVKEMEPLSEFHVYGKVAVYAPSMPGVFAHGFVSNEKDIYYQNDIFVNPILMGGGLKIKCVEALMYAKPLVTTSVGAQGLETGIDKAFLVAEDETDFVDKLLLLLHDSKKKQELSSCSEQVVLFLKESLKKAEFSLAEKIGI